MKTTENTSKIQLSLKQSFFHKRQSTILYLKRLKGQKQDTQANPMIDMWDTYLNFTGLGI